MIRKIVKAAFISVVATATAVVVLRRREQERLSGRLAEVNADELEAPLQEAMLDELGAQL
jgi:hypothetical protein